MKRNIRKIAMILAALVFLGSGAMVGYQYYQYHIGDQAYTEAEELAGVPDFSDVEVELPAPTVDVTHTEEPPVSPEQPPEQEEVPAEEPEEEVVWVDPYADALAAMDFAALQEVNDEVLGWILIPGTPVSYPLVQAADNSKYLNTTWRGSRSSVGAIFLECQNSADLSDYNTIIYGHRTQNRSMFGSLKEYAKLDYWQKHPYIYVTDAAGSKTYTIFAAYEVGVTQPTYHLGFSDEAAKQAFLDFCTQQSVLDTGIVPTVDEQILTLSTCTGVGHETRWVVQAVLR